VALSLVATLSLIFPEVGATAGILIVCLAAFLAVNAATVKRLHDFGRSGLWTAVWWGCLGIWLLQFALLGAEPPPSVAQAFLIGLALFVLGWLAFIFLPGTKEANRFGDTPSVAAGSIAGLVVTVAMFGVGYWLYESASGDFVARAKVDEGPNFASAAKAAVTEYYTQHHVFPASNAQTGLDVASLSSRYVERIEIGDGGAITCIFSGHVHRSMRGKTVILRPSARDGAVNWDCVGGDMPAKCRPAQCR